MLVKAKQILFSCVRTVLFLLFFTLVYRVCAEALLNALQRPVLNDHLLRATIFRARVLYSGLVFFSLSEFLCLRQRALGVPFLPAKTDSRERVWALEILRAPLFWGELALILAALLLPHGFVRDDVVAAFFAALPPVAAQLLALLALVLFFGAALFLAFCSALSWRKVKPPPPNAKRRSVYWDALARNETALPRDGRLAVVLALLRLCAGLLLRAALWCLGAVALGYLLPIFLSFLTLLAEYWRFWLIVLLVLLATHLLLKLFRLFSVIRARKKFLKRLATVCKTRGFSLEIKGHFFIAPFLPNAAVFLHLRAPNAHYVCRVLFLPSKKHSPLYINKDCTVSFDRQWIFFKTIVEQSCFFDLPEGARGFLLFSPCRGNLFLQDNLTEHLLDQGDTVRSLGVFSLTGFLNAFSREVL